MSDAPLSSAEATFLDTLAGGLSKTAGPERDEILSPGTRLLLGVHEGEVKDLGGLEQEAEGYDDELRSPQEQEEDLQREVEEVVGSEPMELDGAPVEYDEEPVDEEPVLEHPDEVVGESLEEGELPPPPSGPQPKPEPRLPDRSKYGAIFSQKRAHPLLLAEIMRDHYGDEWVTWEPETLWWSIRKDFGPVGDLARNKLMALRVALQTDIPWNDWDVFENCGTAWNDQTPIFGAFQPMSPSETAFTVTITKKLHPDFEFGNEVRAYIAAVCEDNGFVYAPKEWFPGAQDLIDRKGWVALLRDDVKRAWRTVKKLPPDQVLAIDFNAKDPVDIHIGKLIAVREYLSARDMAMKKQKGSRASNGAVSFDEHLA